MTFADILARWGLAELASDLGLPVKNVRRWSDLGSIPSEWFAAVVRAAEGRGFHDITLEALAAAAEARRLARTPAASEAA
jgi:hypothetical protein